jgi:hypothetical protein
LRSSRARTRTHAPAHARLSAALPTLARSRLNLRDSTLTHCPPLSGTHRLRSSRRASCSARCLLPSSISAAASLVGCGIWAGECAVPSAGL